MSTPTLVRNPAYIGEPRLLIPACHDGTPFLTVRCSCGATSHVHESQVADIPEDVQVGARCSSCREPIICPPGFFADAFVQMREEGWIE